MDSRFSFDAGEKQIAQVGRRFYRNRSVAKLSGDFFKLLKFGLAHSATFIQMTLEHTRFVLGHRPESVGCGPDLKIFSRPIVLHIFSLLP